MFQPDMPTFSQLQDHFGLLEAQNQSKERYIDFLNEDASMNVITMKPRHGKFVAKRPSDVLKKWPSSEEFTEQEQERYRCFSESVDINIGGADLVVIKNDPEIPIMNYLVQMEGSPYTASHVAHLGNLVPHWYPREMFTKVSFYLVIYISQKIQYDKT